MVQSVAVKHFLSTDTGAPELTGAPGSMAAILNACLVTGYNASAVDSITRSGTTVTVNVSTGHGFEIGSVVEIANADQAEYNGAHRITTATANDFEYELAAGVEPATPATGTIDCRQAPAGWECPFASGDSQRMAFKSAAIDATGMYLYVDDTNNQGTRRTGVKGYESMTDIDTGINPFPYSSSDDKWLWWYKSTNETSTRRWAVIADDKMFFVWRNRDDGNDYSTLECFGDLNSFVPADVYHCLVTGNFSATEDKYCSMLCTIPFHYEPGAHINNSGVAIARDYQGTAAGTIAGIFNGVVSVSSRSTYSDRVCPVPLGYSGVTYPSPVSGSGYLVKPAGMVEVSGGLNLLRGELPGVYAPLNGDGWDNAVPQLIAGSGDLAGEHFMALPFRSGQIQMSSGRSSYGSSYNYRGHVLINICGPWRD